ncbi:MAG TPA: rhamnan synthesis F family protein [Candidatus Gemmiger faecigallinarum]|nr:rhamnan synthesis F family protein [Candidatus Gemmiger faecigallinarum]
MKKRLVIYFYYAPDGQADSACLFALQALRQAGAEVLFVMNGALDAASRQAVRAQGAQLLERENVGLDVGAYRQALLGLGRDGLAGVDELILMNYTLAGPVSPLEQMFAKMDARPELDFWGLTRHYAMKSRRFGGARGMVPEHIQSHFLALRPRLFRSEAFWQYWQSMPLPRSYEQSVAGHETRFTAHFAGLEFAWDTAVDTGDLAGIFVNPIMACPAELLARQGCPFFKRRSFFTPYADELRRTDGAAAAELYDWLKRSTDYPVDELIRSLLRTQPLAFLAQNLHWSAALPAAEEPAPPVRLIRWRRGAPQPEVAAGEIVCLYCPPDTPPRDAADWYARRAAVRLAEDPAARAAAARLLAEHPLAGTASPSVAAFGAAAARRMAEWRAALPALRGEAARLGLKAPVAAETPLPVPAGGCVFLKGDAFAGGLPPLDTPAGWWLLPLSAQANGFGCLSILSPAEASAAPERLACALYDAQDAGESGKNLVRALRRRLRGG